LVLDILLSTVTNVDGTWKKTWREDGRRCGVTSSCIAGASPVPLNNRGQPISAADADEVLDCGKPVNFTYYDHLVGIQNRDRCVKIFLEPVLRLTDTTPAALDVIYRKR
jgi:hypothetical protein